MILDYLTGIFVGERLKWKLAVPPERVLKLIESMSEGSYIERMMVPGIGVRIRGNRFWIINSGIGKLPVSGNSFVHILAGSVKPTAEDCEVEARFRLNMFVFGFAAFWLSFAFLGGLSGGVLGLIRAIKVGDSNKEAGAAMMVLFPFLGVLLMNGFRLITRTKEKEIKAVLSEALLPYMIDFVNAEFLPQRK